FSEDGWLKTGDVGTISPEGFLTLTDRAKDVIKSGGEWISSVDLENALMSHPDVAEAAVVAVPDEKWGERPLATVVLKEGSTADGAESGLPGGPATAVRPRARRAVSGRLCGVGAAVRVRHRCTVSGPPCGLGPAVRSRRCRAGPASLYGLGPAVRSRAGCA